MTKSAHTSLSSAARLEEYDRAKHDAAEMFFDYLHKHVGICGHCGKPKCPGKDSHSTLPASLPLDVVIAATKHAGIDL